MVMRLSGVQELQREMRLSQQELGRAVTRATRRAAILATNAVRKETGLAKPRVRIRTLPSGLWIGIEPVSPSDRPGYATQIGLGRSGQPLFALGGRVDPGVFRIAKYGGGLFRSPAPNTIEKVKAPFPDADPLVEVAARVAERELPRLLREEAIKALGR